jgi:hypothetical protein
MEVIEKCVQGEQTWKSFFEKFSSMLLYFRFHYNSGVRNFSALLACRISGYKITLLNSHPATDRHNPITTNQYLITAWLCAIATTLLALSGLQ